MRLLLILAALFQTTMVGPVKVVGPVTAPSTLLLSPGWTFLQDTFFNPGCSTSSATCTMTVLPTTAGSVWAIQIVTGDTASANKITNANGWTLCSNCSVVTGVGNLDAAYKIGGTAGTTSVTVTITNTPTTFFGFAFLELLPPSGFTASLDTSGNVTPTVVCNTCTGVPLTLTATDAIVQFQEASGAAVAPTWSSWSAPYITDPVFNGIYLNATSGSAPTLTQSGSGGAINFAALAFKSTAGSFTVPTPSPAFSIASYSSSTITGVSCSPTCSLTIPTTAAGDLLFAQSSSVSGTGTISSMSGGGTWVVPTSGTTTCNNTVSSQTNGCAYSLSSTSGVTTVTFTMSASGTYGIDLYEIHRTSGSWTLDTQASNNVATSTNNNIGPALTLSGSNDVIFQELTGTGFFNSELGYPQPYIGSAAGFQVFFDNTNIGGSTGVLLNTTNGAATHWLGTLTGNPITMSAIAFK
jgi:hypothetical protein